MIDQLVYYCTACRVDQISACAVLLSLISIQATSSALHLFIIYPFLDARLHFFDIICFVKYNNITSIYFYYYYEQPYICVQSIATLD